MFFSLDLNTYIYFFFFLLVPCSCLIPTSVHVINKGNDKFMGHRKIKNNEMRICECFSSLDFVLTDKNVYYFFI